MKPKRKLAILFWVLAAIQFFILNLDEYIFIRPQSIHQWRQTVSLNITLNFMEQDNGLLQPETNLLNADNGTTGIAQGEFPLFYFAVGRLWRLTGQQEWLYRLITLTLFLLALRAIADFLFRETGKILGSVVVPLLFFATPVLAYYAVSFLMDSVSLSLIILGWHALYRLTISGNKIWYLWLFIAFLLAGLFKVTSLISFIALIGWSLGTLLLPRFFGKPETAFWRLPILGIGAFILVLNAVWYTFAISYNNQHGGWYTENGIYPIWELTQERWSLIADWVASYWYYQYAPGVFYFLFAGAVLFLILIKKQGETSRFVAWIAGLTFFGSLTYVLLWIQVFHEHDYYIIALYPFFLIIILSSYLMLYKRLTNIGYGFFTFFLVLVLLHGSYLSGKQLHYRLVSWPNNEGHNRFESFFDIEPYLRNDLGLSRTDRIITYSDESVCISLYLADQKGWQMNAQHDTTFLRSRIENGAEYILVNDSSFYTIEGIQDFELKPIGKHKKIDVLKVPEQSFSKLN